MKETLRQIQSGEFAREWILENRAGRPVFNALARQDQNHQIEQVGRELRAMMSWVKNSVNQNVTQQNESIKEQNALMNKVAQERDDYARKLNDSIKQYNSLVVKYNDLVRQSERPPGDAVKQPVK